VIASAFKVGRVLRLGDAAHRDPPTGGLGLTSAIHDAQNLCWKVTAVLSSRRATQNRHQPACVANFRLLRKQSRLLEVVRLPPGAVWKPEVCAELDDTVAAGESR
jgi:2-polyprenyl-6-methoxyphenol hydroxylase-like FAD-dependent oxidoreductase